MKKGLAVFLLLLFAVPVWAQGKIKLGFIDIQRAIRESQAGLKARERFRAEVKKIEVNLFKEQKEVERLKRDFDKKGPLLKEDERRNLEKVIQKRYVAYQRKARDSQQELRQREREITDQILKDLERIVTELGKSEKFTLIVERSQILYSDQGIDITKKVIDLYDRRTAGKVTKGK